MSTSLPYGHWESDDDEDPHREGYRTWGRDDEDGFEPHGFPRPPEGFSGGSSESGRFAPLPRTAACPKCGSKLTRALQWGRKFGCILGAVAGAAGGAAAGCIGAPRLPVPSLRWVSLISSAVIGGISGGTAGCKSGASLGDLLDERILPNHKCQDCSKWFSHPIR